MSQYLGQFTDENAEAIIEAFEDAGISWSEKRSGAFVRVVFAADWGVRLFVADADAERGWAIARRIAPDGLARPEPG